MGQVNRPPLHFRTFAKHISGRKVVGNPVGGRARPGKIVREFHAGDFAPRSIDQWV